MRHDRAGELAELAEPLHLTSEETAELRELIEVENYDRKPERIAAVEKLISRARRRVAGRTDTSSKENTMPTKILTQTQREQMLREVERVHALPAADAIRVDSIDPELRRMMVSEVARIDGATEAEFASKSALYVVGLYAGAIAREARRGDGIKPDGPSVLSGELDDIVGLCSAGGADRIEAAIKILQVALKRPPRVGPGKPQQPTPANATLMNGDPSHGPTFSTGPGPAPGSPLARGDARNERISALMCQRGLSRADAEDAISRDERLVAARVDAGEPAPLRRGISAEDAAAFERCQRGR
nr:hypothetical protein [Kofleriaceae bacterium]